MSRYYSTFKDDVVLEYMEVNGYHSDDIINYMNIKSFDGNSPLKSDLKGFREYIKESIGSLQHEIDKRETEMEDWLRLLNEIEVHNE